MRSAGLIGLCGVWLLSAPAAAQMVAPSRSYSPQTPIDPRGVVAPKQLYPDGYDALLKGAPKPAVAPTFGYHAEPLKSVVIATRPAKPVPADTTDTTLAEPLTGKEPGTGRMTQFLDSDTLPGQKPTPMEAVK